MATSQNISTASLEPPDTSSSRSTRTASPLGATRTTLQIDLGRPERITSPSNSQLAGRVSSSDAENSSNVFRLQPADEGFGAWSYAFCAFTMFVVVWGFPEAFPVFQLHLSTREPFAHSTVLPLLSPGMNDIIEGLLFPILPRSPKYRRPLVLTGIGVISVSMILASSATTDWQIVLTQCVMFGVGGIMLNFVHVSLFSEWFEKQKVQAMSFIWQGWRLGSLGFPLICQWLLGTLGYETTLQWLLAFMVPLLLPAIIVFRGRYPEAQVQAQPAQPTISRIAAFRAPKVLFHLFVVLLFSMVVNVPTMFIMPYGSDMGLDASHQVTAYSLRSISAMVGIYALGKYTNGSRYELFMIISPILSSLTYIFVWGFATTKLTMYMYAIIIGLVSGGYDNVLYSMYSEISGDNQALFTAVHGLFSLIRGISVLSIGPVGTAITRLTPEVARDQYALGKYKFLILYTASMSMASGLLLLGRLMYLKPQFWRQTSASAP